MDWKPGDRLTHRYNADLGVVLSIGAEAVNPRQKGNFTAVDLQPLRIITRLQNMHPFSDLQGIGITKLRVIDRGALGAGDDSMHLFE